MLLVFTTQARNLTVFPAAMKATKQETEKAAVSIGRYPHTELERITAPANFSFPVHQRQPGPPGQLLFIQDESIAVLFNLQLRRHSYPENVKQYLLHNYPSHNFW